MIKPGPWAWSPGQVSPELQQLASKLSFGVPLWYSTRDVVRGLVPTIQTGVWHSSIFGTSWRTITQGQKIVWPYAAHYCLEDVSWSLCVIFTPLTETGVQSPIIGQFDNPNSNGAWNLFGNWSPNNILGFNYRTSGTTRNINFNVGGLFQLGQHYVICVTRGSDGVWRLYRNGHRVGDEVAESFSPVLSTSLPLVMSHEFASTTTDDFTNGDYAAIYIWKGYELTKYDVGLLSADPFGPFRPAPRIFSPQTVVKRHRGWSRPGV